MVKRLEDLYTDVVRNITSNPMGRASKDEDGQIYWHHTAKYEGMETIREQVDGELSRLPSGASRITVDIVENESKKKFLKVSFNTPVS